MKNINVFYWLDEPNFGDMLNYNICKNLFNVEILESTPQDCEATFIGSLLDCFLYKKIFKTNKSYIQNYNKEPVKIWGTGFIDDKNQRVKRKFNLPEIFFRRMEIFALRGKYSKYRIESILQKQLGNILLADPGILAPKLIDYPVEKKYAYGIIPHHAELNMDIWEKFNSSECKIIRFDNKNVIETIKEISECEFIFSSALHGLIVSDAFGIPNCKVIASDRLAGGLYKFYDYYSAYNISDFNLLNIESLKEITKTIKQMSLKYKIPFELILKKQEELIRTFPYN